MFNRPMPSTSLATSYALAPAVVARFVGLALVAVALTMFASTALVFLLLGLLIGEAAQAVADRSLLLTSAVATVTVIGLRFAWVFSVPHLRRRVGMRSVSAPSWKEAVVLGWAGMRGVVSLALALALPLLPPNDAHTRRSIVAVTFVVIVITLGSLVQSLAPWLHNVQENPLQKMLTSPWRVATFALVVVLAGGVREEVQRAFILHRFEQDLGGVRLGLVLFSVAFGLGHLTQGRDAAIITGSLGFFWGLLYLSRRSMIAPAVSHAFFNLIEIAIYQYASKNGLLP